MQKNRLEAFSDGVIAIIITIMVLELKVPQGNLIADLIPLWPVFVSYVLSFTYVGIYWNNHHHMLHTVKKVNGRVLLANLNLLFWLSLVPFVTGWMGENHFAATPTAVYGVVMLMAALAYFILQNIITCSEPENALLRQAIGNDRKGKISLIMYIIAIISAYQYEGLSQIIYAAVALMWIVPDSRIEKTLTPQQTDRKR